MAEQDFDINIRTRADLSGATQTGAALTELQRRAAATTPGQALAERDAAARAAAAPGLAGPGDIEGKLTHGFERFALHAAGIGALVGFLDAIKQTAEEINKITDELDKQGALLVKHAQSYSDAAKFAKDEAETLKIAEAAVKDMEAANERMGKAQQKELTYYQQFLDSLFKGGIPGIGPIEQAIVEGPKAIEAQNEQTAQAVAMNSIRAAQRAQELRDAKTFDQTVADLNAKIREQEELQAAHMRSGDPGSWVATTRNLQGYKKELVDTLKLEEEREKAAVARAQGLAKGLLEPTGQFISEQQSAQRKHLAERAALEEQRREAVATGNKEEANAITENLKHDRFGRDQRKEQLQRYVADQESLFRIPGEDTAQRLRDLGKEGLRKYEAAQAELGDIYKQQRGERREMGVGITDTQRIVEAINNLAALWK